MKFLITHRRFEELKEADLKCFVAVKIMYKKTFFGLGKTIKTTEIIGETEASNYMWAHDNFLGFDYDYMLEVKPV